MEGRELLRYLMDNFDSIDSGFISIRIGGDVSFFDLKPKKMEKKRDLKEVIDEMLKFCCEEFGLEMEKMLQHRYQKIEYVQCRNMIAERLCRDWEANPKAEYNPKDVMPYFGRHRSSYYHAKEAVGIMLESKDPFYFGHKHNYLVFNKRFETI